MSFNAFFNEKSAPIILFLPEEKEDDPDVKTGYHHIKGTAFLTKVRGLPYTLSGRRYDASAAAKNLAKYIAKHFPNASFEEIVEQMEIRPELIPEIQASLKQGETLPEVNAFIIAKMAGLGTEGEIETGVPADENTLETI